jgi:hypothetical protein
MSVFQRLGKGVKTTFGIKDLTPQQQAETQKKKAEAQAYKQILSAKEKEAMQMAYQQELIRQRQVYSQEKQTEAVARGMARARTEVQTY